MLSLSSGLSKFAIFLTIARSSGIGLRKNPPPTSFRKTPGPTGMLSPAAAMNIPIVVLLSTLPSFPHAMASISPSGPGIFRLPANRSRLEEYSISA